MAVQEDFDTIVYGKTEPGGTIGAVILGAERLLRRVAGNVRRWRLEAQTVRMLSALDDHILYDVGVDRGGIRSAVREIVDGGRVAR